MYDQTTYTFFTAPSGPKSINNEDDASESAKHCLPQLLKNIDENDGLLIACYSKHPLVPQLKTQKVIAAKGRPIITGIFEASVATSLQIIAPHERFGIVSTGKVWEQILTEAVANFLGSGKETSSRFAGVETTGLNATELHDAQPQEVRTRMKEATKRLIRKGDVGAVCLGCAGMAGMNEMVKEAAIEELGEDKGSSVRVVDGVEAGVTWLEGAIRASF